MERIANKARNHKEAEIWDISQHINMTPQERLEIVDTLKKKVYGEDVKDVREWHNKK